MPANHDHTVHESLPEKTILITGGASRDTG